MLPDRVTNPGPLTYESGALPTALRGPAGICLERKKSLYLITQEIWYFGCITTMLKQIVPFLG